MRPAICEITKLLNNYPDKEKFRGRLVLKAYRCNKDTLPGYLFPSEPLE